MVRIAKKFQKDVSDYICNFCFMGRKHKKRRGILNNLIQIARGEINKLEKTLERIDEFLCKAPDGCLKWQNRGEKTYYYQQYPVAEEDGKQKWARRYLKKDEIQLAKQLAKKHYYSLVKSVAEKRLEALRHFIKKYPDSGIDDIYDDLSEERKSLISPLFMSVKEQVKQWESEVYEQTTMYPENLKFETEQGDVVRSKSEVIIANLLYKYRKDILYKYERPLNLIVNGIERTIYPDFTIINKHTGKITYWEHAGRMDASYYAEDFVRKMNIYATNDLLPGRDVVLTFETQENPLDIGVVKKLVKGLI